MGSSSLHVLCTHSDCIRLYRQRLYQCSRYCLPHRLGWTVVNAPAEVTDCSGTKMFGGFGKFGAGATATKVFELPPHHTIYLKLQFWK